MSARDEVLAAYEEIKALGALLDGEDSDDKARRYFKAAHDAAWRKARRAATAYYAEAGGKPAPKKLTLEERRARVAEVFSDGMREARRLLGCATIDDGDLTGIAAAYAQGKVAK